MKTYEVFTEKYSKIYQADGIESVIRKHHKVSNDEIVAVTIADRPDLLSKVDQLEPEGEEIDQGRVEEIVKQFDPTNQLTWQEAVMFRQGIKFGYSEKSTPPPQQPSEGDIDQAIHDICVFEERLTRHYQAAQQPIDEIRKLQQRQRNAIKELLNPKR